MHRGLEFKKMTMGGWTRRRVIVASVLGVLILAIAVGLTDDDPLPTYHSFNIISGGVGLDGDHFTFEDDCLYLEYIDQRLIQYFNALATRWDPDTLTVSRLNGDTYGMGEPISDWGASPTDSPPRLPIRKHAPQCEEKASGFILME